MIIKKSLYSVHLWGQVELTVDCFILDMVWSMVDTSIYIYECATPKMGYITKKLVVKSSAL